MSLKGLLRERETIWHSVDRLASYEHSCHKRLWTASIGHEFTPLNSLLDKLPEMITAFFQFFKGLFSFRKHLRPNETLYAVASKDCKRGKHCSHAPP